MEVKDSERSYPVNVFEKGEIKNLFDFYKKQGSPITMRFEDELNNVMIIKYFQLLEGIGGLSSVTEDDKHVGFIDVEDIGWTELKEKLKKVQEEFDHSTWYVLSSSFSKKKHKGNFHCICLDKDTFGHWIDVLKFFDNERTLQYQRFAVNRGRFVLRVTIKGKKEKPKLFKVLARESKKKEKSWGHWYFLRLRYGYKFLKPKNLDHHAGIVVEKYTTVRK